MPLILNGDGNVTGLTPGGLPDASIIQADLAAGVAGNGPAFSAGLSSNQTLTSSTWTKLQFNSELFDTASCYDSSTNYRFTPNVPGYYQVNLGGAGGTSLIQALGVSVYKNGAAVAYQTQYLASLSYGDDLAACISRLIYMNGTTDYIEAYGFVVDASAGSDVFSGSSVYCWFEGYLVRSA
jgi:hypothetical protein